MIEIHLVTEMRAPIERCFDAARSVDLHLASARGTDERAIGGVTSGLMEAGDEVTWRARHLGVFFTLTSRITRMDRPHSFQDRMVRGPFAFFEHDHDFEQTDDLTRMRETLRFAAPLGPLGRLADVLLLRRHLTRFLIQRNVVLRQAAESG